MMRKYQVRFGGGRMEKGPSGYLASRLPYNAFTAAARRLPDEQRYDLEMLAGQLAAHGVAAYAPRLKRRGAIEPGEARSAMQSNRQELTPLDSEAVRMEPTNATANFAGADIVDLARDMFQADIVGRRLTGRRP